MPKPMAVTSPLRSSESAIEKRTTGVTGFATDSGTFSERMMSAMSLPQNPVSGGVMISFAWM